MNRAWWICDSTWLVRKVDHGWYIVGPRDKRSTHIRAARHLPLNWYVLTTWG